MKKHRLPFLISLLILGSLLLSACGGGALVNTWPGLAENQNVIYLSYQGALYAISAANGSKVWNFPNEPSPGTPFYAAPTFSDGIIIVGNYGRTLYALDTNGQQKWSFEIPRGNFVATPLVEGSTVLAPASNDTLYALDLNGNELWSFKSQNMLWAQPASNGELVFLPALDHNLYALNIADGSKVWTVDMGSALLSHPVQDEDGTVYVATLEGMLYAVNPDGGEVVWNVNTQGRLWSAPALHEGTLFLGNSNGKVLAISTEDGSTVWQVEAGSPVIGGGAVLPDGVAFATENGQVIAINFDGEQMWKQTVNGKLYTTPVVAGDKLVVAVMEGENQLQAFNLDGQPAWPFTLPR